MQNAQTIADLSVASPVVTNVAPPFEFQCGDCGRIELSREAEIPVGWDKFDYKGRHVVRCDDCLEMIERNHGDGVVAETQPDPLAIDSTGFAYVDGALCSLHSGCRARVWPMPEVGAAIVHLQGGTADGRDPALGILVSLDREDLQTLIAGLVALEAGIAPGAIVGEA